MTTNDTPIKLQTSSAPMELQPPCKKVKIAVDTAALVQKLNKIDSALNDKMIHLGQCGSPKGDGDEDDDEVGDENSPWSGYIMALAIEIDAMRRERIELARELKTLGITVEPIDDGY